MENKEQICKVWFADGRIWVETSAGNHLSQPLEVFPPLFYATDEEREDYYLWSNDTSIRWEKLDEDIHISNFYTDETVNYNNEVNSLLSRFPWLDMKAFAEHIGMHWTKLARFRFGVWTPTNETLQKIKNGIRELGREMGAAVF